MQKSEQLSSELTRVDFVLDCVPTQAVTTLLGITVQSVWRALLC